MALEPSGASSTTSRNPRASDSMGNRILFSTLTGAPPQSPRQRDSVFRSLAPRRPGPPAVRRSFSDFPAINRGPAGHGPYAYNSDAIFAQSRSIVRLWGRGREHSRRVSRFGSHGNDTRPLLRAR